MHHPGPPRFLHVGESVELAPRNPDPSAEFAWRLLDQPAESSVTIGDGAVVHLAPDVPGIYRVELDAPDGVHTQTVRAFPDPCREARFSVTAADVDGDLDGVDHAAVIGQFNDFTMGTHRAERTGEGDRADADDRSGEHVRASGNAGGEWTLDVALPPGTHEAIFAFGDEFDPHATSEVTVEGAGRPRVRLDGRREDDEIVVTATADAAPDGSVPSVEYHLDDRDALTRDAVTVDDETLRAPVDALPELSRVHAVAVAERHSIADTLTIRAEQVGERTRTVSVDRPADPPGWVRDATVYEIFVRAFAGDTVDTTFAEIERRVPYLASLGIDAVWLTPVCASPTRHGYHITDLFDTAADLGTRAEFVSLVDRLHDAGIRVLFDLVINHTSRDHPAFQLHRAGVPEYADHYERVPAAQDTTGVDWAGDDAPGHYFTWSRIPNLNYDSLAVREWMLDVVDEWAPLVDGFRCDVAWGVSHGFWKEVRERLKARDETFLLLDETVPRDAAFRENEFDVHYDTDLYATLRDIGTGDVPANSLFDALDDSRRHGYPDEALHMRYVENHDEDRYAADCDDGSLRPAAAATFTLPGVPMIYYGQERGVPTDRGTMRWHDGDADLTEFHRRLVTLRNEHPALRAPGVESVACDVYTGDPDHVVAYERGTADERLIVVLNFGSDPAVVTPDRDVDHTDQFGESVWTEDGIRVDDIAVLTTSNQE
ncbi:alpha-amylase family glycosyl hydrolase [Halococcus saccharolyticus]|uniref:Alpha amylase / alpha-glucosidase n=1 Tax=Halococcus saccharolyticus DSM 5350 TaxID=1227455 RepID=M0MFQ4_9EURY|nr:alpha-amylase family glycosyl hydrolase [Halococcus saccharolyticus]EMA43265.1 alpha amylase / alpha-glucosidase [Halococcus saccharolyticus DSM 5350]